MTKQYNVAGFNLYLPEDHLLDSYQSKWCLYDRSLGNISKSISAKYPKMTAIDIGANIGDSAALIQQFQPVPTLCIEGNPDYLEYLEINAKIIGNINIADCFIGEDGASVALDLLNSNGGTTSIINAISSDSLFASEMISLESLLSYYPLFINSKLLKIDTDGFDFKIIYESQKFIQSSEPIIYFEYDITFTENGFETALLTIDLLRELNYKKFAIYDNFGNHLINLDGQDSQYFYDLTNYLLSSRYKSGQPVIYYFDICAFPQTDTDIFTEIYSNVPS